MRFRYYDDDLAAAIGAGARVLSVDGVVPGDGPNVSHWPGNRSPGWLRADTSTEMVLRLLASPERDLFLDKVEIVTNNHYDVDGALAVAAAVEPDFAREHAGLFVAAATFGDFSRVRDERAAKLALALEAEDERASDEVQYAFALENIRGLVLDLDRFAGRFENAWARIEADLALLAEGKVEVRAGETPDFAVVRAPRPLGYEALVTAAGMNAKILSIVPAPEGWIYELFETIDTWFVMGTREWRPRRSLAPLARRLDALEGRPFWRASPACDLVMRLGPRAPGEPSGLTPEAVALECASFFLDG
jgi:hypothetical protein